MGHFTIEMVIILQIRLIRMPMQRILTVDLHLHAYKIQLAHLKPIYNA